jgi:hypothetical protein
MTLQLELWHAILLAIAFLGFVFAAGKILLNQVEKHIDERFTTQTIRLSQIEASQKQDANRWIDLERQFLNFKADLPLNYVRREDYVQAVASIMIKLDAMSVRFENILLRGQKNHE